MRESHMNSFHPFSKTRFCTGICILDGYDSAGNALIFVMEFQRNTAKLPSH